MPIAVRCPNPACGAGCSVADADAGRPVKCAICGKTFAIRPTLDGRQADTKKGRPSGNTDLFPTLPADFGRYRVLRLLGKGGMGAVYLAEDTRLGRRVALKIPFFDAAESTQRAERFVREARSAALLLHHPNICTVFDADQLDGRAFITMAYVEGKSLADEIDPDAPMPQRRAAEIARKIALALGHAHGKGTVHRDLKPANVMLTADGEPVVMDFGLAKRIADVDPSEAKLTRLGGVIGTPSYMSPEQVRGDGDIGPTADVYSLGVMLFEMLAGKPPYAGSMGVVMGQVLHAPVPPVREFRADVDARLEAICAKAMAKEAGARFVSMAEFAEALGEYANAPVAAPRPLPSPPMPVVAVREIAPVAAPRALPPPPPPIPSAPAQQRSTFEDLEEPPARTRVAKKRGKPSPIHPVMLAGIAAAMLTLVAVVAVALFAVKPKAPIVAKPQPLPATKENPTPPALEKEIVNSIGMKLVRIPAGKFVMGSPLGEGFDDARPEHEVEITKAFYMGIHEVTQKQFEAVMGYNPSHFSRNGEAKPGVPYSDYSKPGGGKAKLEVKNDPDGFPVENVSWDEAKEFCEKLSAMKEEKEKKRSYRLPTEAEWEYACRGGAGSKTPYHFGQTLSSTQANFGNSNLGRTCEVGSYRPNGFGLYDMHGNVWEWCSDWYGEKYYAVRSPRDPRGPSERSYRVSRGGSWNDSAGSCSAAYRSANDPAARYNSLGFRLLLSSAPGQ